MASVPDLARTAMIPGLVILGLIVLLLWEGYNEIKARQS